MAAQYDFTLTQNESFYKAMIYKDTTGVPINLTGLTAAMQIRNSAGVAIVSLTSSAGISLGGTTGAINISIDPTVTVLLNFSTAHYDLWLYGPNNYKKQLLRGTVSLNIQETI